MLRPCCFWAERPRLALKGIRTGDPLFDHATTVLPSKIATLADTQNLAETVCGEFCFRLVDDTELHRLPSLAKKGAARFSISRSCRKISFSRRKRFSLAAMSPMAVDLGGASIA
jgi:hypothetical protein